MLEDNEDHLGHRLTVEYKQGYVVLFCKDDKAILSKVLGRYTKQSSNCCSTCKMVFENEPT